MMADNDEQEYAHLQRIADEFYELEYPEQPLNQYSVALTSGNRVFLYTTPGGADAVRVEGFDVHEITDDEYVSIHPDSTQYSAEELNAMPRPNEPPSTPRRPRPRLPRQKLGRHHQADVVSLDQQRLKPPRGEPSMPFGAPSTGVTKLPRHRRRDT
jgi:hypothetical protein